jgi:hypothetical protein
MNGFFFERGLFTAGMTSLDSLQAQKYRMRGPAQPVFGPLPQVNAWPRLAYEFEGDSQRTSYQRCGDKGKETQKRVREHLSGTLLNLDEVRKRYQSLLKG